MCSVYDGFVKKLQSTVFVMMCDVDDKKSERNRGNEKYRKRRDIKKASAVILILTH